MQIKYICPLWGSEDLDFEFFLEKAKSAGYEGVEFSLHMKAAMAPRVIELIASYEMIYIAQHWETHTANFSEHIKEYEQRLEYLASAKPYLINAHTGKDYFNFDQNLELIELARSISEKHGIPLVHETHRGRFSFAAHICKNYLEHVPGLRLALDLSHWCNVAESFLEDQQEAVVLAIARTEHIHARVGFPEGPQIPDPRDPKWKQALNIHTNWWKKVIGQQDKNKREFFTITPEFGPEPYMQIVPKTGEPLADQWEINAFMLAHLKQALNNC